MSKNLSTTLALSAAALFLGGCQKDAPSTTNPDDATASSAETAKAAKMKCFGVNECKGQSACDVPDGRVAEGSKGHACGGLNECKGKGWKLQTREACDEQGGEPL